MNRMKSGQQIQEGSIVRNRFFTSCDNWVTLRSRDENSNGFGGGMGRTQEGAAVTGALMVIGMI